MDFAEEGGSSGGAGGGGAIGPYSGGITSDWSGQTSDRLLEQDRGWQGRATNAGGITIVGLRQYGTVVGEVPLRLWTTGGDLLRELVVTTVDNVAAGEWTEGFFDTPVELADTEQFVVSGHWNKAPSPVPYAQSSSLRVTQAKVAYETGRYGGPGFPSFTNSGWIYGIVDVLVLDE